MQLVFGHDAAVAAFAAEKLGLTISPPYVAIGVADEFGLKGAAVYNNWNRWQIEISFYGPGCLTRPVIRALFWGYPFNDLGAGRLTASTRRSNRLTRDLLPRLGFTQEAVLKRLYGPRRADDAFVFCMMREQAERWKHV
jgi:hypothetical protein